MERWLLQWEQHGFGLWAISFREAPETVIGFGGLSYRQFGELEKINLGYRFSTQVWGQGLATELSRKALDFGFRTLDAEEIWALVRETHLASQRVLEKAGMKQIAKVAEPLGGAGSFIYQLHRSAYLGD